MALNCAMISQSNYEPIPLPDEKIFLRVSSVTISLKLTGFGSSTTSNDQSNFGSSSSNQNDQGSSNNPGKFKFNDMLTALTKSEYDDDGGKGSLGSSRGNIYVTNQRIIFVSSSNQNKSPTSPPPELSTSVEGPQNLREIRTLTIPLNNSKDGRFIQPWLSANYHLSNFTPVSGGNLDTFARQNSDTNNAPGQVTDLFALKVLFHEGHGFEFHEALEEAKRLMFDSGGRRPLEDLPMYTPADGPEQPSENRLGFGQTSSPEFESLSNLGGGEGSSSNNENNFRRTDRSNSMMPDPDLLAAAEIAQEEERQERDGALIVEPPPDELSVEPSELPPSYQP